MNVDDFLEHYGVKGMKWGVRRSREQLARARSERKAAKGNTRKGKAAKAERKRTANQRRQLSDEQLNSYINRLEQERRLKQLVDEDLSPGRAAARRIASQAGQRTAQAVVSGAAAYAVKAAIEGNFDLGEAAKFITPRNPNRKNK